MSSDREGMPWVHVGNTAARSPRWYPHEWLDWVASTGLDGIPAHLDPEMLDPAQ